MFKVMFVLYLPEGMDRSESLRYWRESHGPIAAKIPGTRRYVQHHAVGAPDGNPSLLGMATIEFDSERAWLETAASPEMSAAVADLVNFADPERLPTVFVEDATIVG